MMSCCALFRPVLALLPLCCSLMACSTVEVADKTLYQKVSPWEKQHLSNPAMAWEVDAVEAVLERHITFSKEASSGGEQSAGGGCGCN